MSAREAAVRAPTEPSQTVYFNNLNDKIRKDELKRCLYALCSQFGPILDVVALRTLAMRGQAFVVFAKTASAVAAVQHLNQFAFFDKPMRASFARTKSDIVARLDGTYDPAAREAAREAARANARRRKLQSTLAEGPALKRPSRMDAAAASLAAIQGTGPASSAARNPPSNVLFVQNVPRDPEAAQAVEALFRGEPGFQECKMPANLGVAFVIYESEAQATEAMARAQGMQYGEDARLLVAYAKK